MAQMAQNLKFKTSKTTELFYHNYPYLLNLNKFQITAIFHFPVNKYFDIIQLTEYIQFPHIIHS